MSDNKENFDKAADVLVTWFKAKNMLSNSACWWVCHLAFLAHEPVPAALAEALHSLEPGEKSRSWKDPDSGVVELFRHSLLVPSSATFGNAGQMHGLIQQIVRESIDDAKQKQFRQTVVNAMRLAFSGDMTDHTKWPRLEPLVPHVESLLAMTALTTTDPSGDLGFLGNHCGMMLRTMARFAAAEPLYRQALSIDEKSFGPEHPNVARGLNNLAGLLQATNRQAEAEPLYGRASVIVIRSLGAEHPRSIDFSGNYRNLLNQFRKDSETVEREFAAMCVDAGTDAVTLCNLIRQKYSWIR